MEQLEGQVSPDHEDLEAQQEDQVVQVLSALQAFPDLWDREVTVERMVLQETLVHLAQEDLQDLVVNRENLDPKDHLALSDPLDHEDQEDQREIVENLDHQELWVNQASRDEWEKEDHLAPRETWENLEHKVQWAHQDLEDLMDHEESPEARVYLVRVAHLASKV